ncbi:MAG: GNAT family N-acetyltransferase [Chloroflexota bacterium]
MAVAERQELQARTVTDRDLIASFLRTDRLYAAYPLGDLDGPGRRRVEWGMSFDASGRPIALAMHHEGLVPQPLFLMGDVDGCRAILSGVLKPRDAYFQTSAVHEAAIRELYDLEPPVAMLRMTVDRDNFVPFAGPAERLGAADIEELNRLYQLGFRSGFPAAVLEEGVYYGVRVRGHVVAAAGTHVVSSREGIAVVGNVMTQAEYRGHDFAKMVTSAVTADLLERVSDVTLNVHADNAPAVAAYSRVGYGVYCELVERIGRRRSGGWGLMRPIREAIRLTWPRDSR